MKKSLTLVLCGVLVAGTVMADSEAVRRKIANENYDNNAPRTVDCNVLTPLAAGTYTIAPGETWYFSYTGTGVGLELQTCNPGTDFDTDMDVFDNCADLNSLHYRDGDSGCAHQSWATYLNCDEFTFDAGVEYVIGIDGYGGGGGTFELTIGMPCDPPAGPPANDNMADAEEIMVDGPCATGSTASATQDNAPPMFQHACYSGYYSATSTGNAPDVWYWFQSAGGCYDVSLENSTYDTALGLFDAAGNPLASNDDTYGLQSGLHTDQGGCHLPAGMIYVVVDGFGTSTGDYELCVTSCAVADVNEVPVEFALGNAYPNPFNPTTTINFTMSETAEASLAVFNLAGQQVASLVNGVVQRGENSVVFDASSLTSGVYFYTLEANGLSQTRKMVLVK